MGDHVQTGVVACCHVGDYDRGVIKKHEETRPLDEDDRTRHITVLGAHTGPVLLCYRDDRRIDALAAAAQAHPPLLQVHAPDGVNHTIWRVTESDAYAGAFQAVEAAYIADGHHRTAAASRVARERGATGGARGDDDEANWFLAVLFPASQLQVLPYHRVVHDLNGETEAEFLVAVRERFRVTPAVPPTPRGPRHVTLYLSGQWYDLNWAPVERKDPVSSLDVSVLQDQLLAPVLGIGDPRRSPRISFVGGIRSLTELARVVDSGEAAAALAMHPVSIEQMMNVSDAGLFMPPKSTWFEPKLKSGLFVHLI
jgi:uncharacterized protein (DUF1015 family)